ncbi:hypothetical protein CF327_g422 [Tilletia walkeri]|uniref:Kinase n=1 Tax=Tilletia walkeri TaxID=117179 RepID=A0A8X7T894_9BASI|nr:hypothetical protein CF327_g422 [Tilletia walkeri]KAE8272159.1 hypothetical protein A4X09_0g196 [Tilletia walkeri]
MNSASAVSTSSASMTAADVAARHLLAILEGPSSRKTTLIVGIQGPQGIGKSTLVKNLVSKLANFPTGRSIRAAALSIDDLYLPHKSLLELKERHPQNGLLHGRGLPGTHDVKLGSEILSEVKRASIGTKSRSIRLPVYDKSLHDGAGDRTEEATWPALELRPRMSGSNEENSNDSKDHVPPLDVFLLEGWCLGFRPLPDDVVKSKYEEALRLRESRGTSLSSAFELDQPLHFTLRHSLDSLLEVNEKLRQYESEWYPHIDTFIQLWPASESPAVEERANEEYKALDAFPSSAKALVFQWRLEAEHWMKKNVSKGKGMTDDQVKDFVARYMPAYELFSGGQLGSVEGDRSGSERSSGLRIELDEKRAVVHHQTLM